MATQKKPVRRVSKDVLRELHFEALDLHIEALKITAKEMKACLAKSKK